jgi:hypothetical protein
VSDQGAAFPLLQPVAAAAARLTVSKSTVVRLMDDGALVCVRQRSRRRANAGQVDYVVRAIRSGRSGSLEQFAAEWAAMQQEQVSA